MFHYFFFKFNIFLNIFYFKKDKRKGNQKSIEESSCSSTPNDFDTFIDKKLNIHDMNRIQIKSDNAVQSVIINSLDESTQEYLCGW